MIYSSAFSLGNNNLTAEITSFTESLDPEGLFTNDSPSFNLDLFSSAFYPFGSTLWTLLNFDRSDIWFAILRSTSIVKSSHTDTLWDEILLSVYILLNTLRI